MSSKANRNNLIKTSSMRGETCQSLQTMTIDVRKRVRARGTEGSEYVER